MSNQARNSEDEPRRLVVAITDFLRDQLIARTDLVPEDRDCLEIAIQCLEMAYGLESDGYIQFRFSRPLLDIFNQVTNPVSVRDKLRADAHKDAGNSYMRRSMFDNAENEYTHAIELDKWNAIYYCNRASARIEQRNYFDAIADCRQALQLNSDYAKAHARMGQAYALIQRPREAARCFRQALELEPENERYRNNLRVAESQISNTPDAVGLITSLLGSLFGMRPPNSPPGSPQNISMPSSFMIITESHPPTRETPSETAVSTDNAQETKATDRTSSNEIPNIVYPNRFGIVDEGSEEQPITPPNLPIVNTAGTDSEGTEEFLVQFPRFFIFEAEEDSTEQTSEQRENTEQGEETKEPSEIARDHQTSGGQSSKYDAPRAKSNAPGNISETVTNTNTAVTNTNETTTNANDNEQINVHTVSPVANTDNKRESTNIEHEQSSPQTVDKPCPKEPADTETETSSTATANEHNQNDSSSQKVQEHNARNAANLLNIQNETHNNQGPSERNDTTEDLD